MTWNTRYLGSAILIVICMHFGTIHAQNLITGSTARNAEITKKIPTEQVALSDFIGNNTLKTSFFSLNGKENTFSINVPAIEGKIDVSTLSGTLTADLHIIKIGLVGDPSATHNSLFVKASLGSMELELSLDFESGMAAITSSTAISNLKPTPYTLTVRNEKLGINKEISGIAGENEKQATGTLRYSPIDTPLVYDVSTSVKGNASTKGMNMSISSTIDSSYELMIQPSGPNILNVTTVYRKFEGTSTVHSKYLNQTVPIEDKKLVGKENTFSMSPLGTSMFTNTNTRKGVFLPTFPDAPYSPGMTWSEETSFPLMVGQEGQMNSNVNLHYQAVNGEKMVEYNTIQITFTGTWSGSMKYDIPQGTGLAEGHGTISGKALFCPSKSAFLRYSFNYSGDIVQTIGAGGYSMQTNLHISVTEDTTLQ